MPQEQYQIPSAVAISKDGRVVAIARDSTKSVQLCYFSSFSENSVTLIHTLDIPCSGQPLSLVISECFRHEEEEYNNEHVCLSIVTSNIEEVVLQYTLTLQNDKINIFPHLHSNSSLMKLLQNYLSSTYDDDNNNNNKSKLQMPNSILEYKYNHQNQTTNQKIKMFKGNDPVGFDHSSQEKSTWNNSRERKEKDRLKQARIRKRKREQQQQQQQLKE